MSGCIKTLTILVDIQENGIIRVHDTGRYIGRLDETDGLKYEQLSEHDVFYRKKVRNE